jgi:hypothetical protein
VKKLEEEENYENEFENEDINEIKKFIYIFNLKIYLFILT